MDWNTDKSAGLSYRMAGRMKLALQDPETVDLSARRIMSIGLCKDNVRNSYVPKFLQELDLDEYDDDWNDWQPDEIKALGERLAAGMDKDETQALFSVPSRIINSLTTGSIRHPEIPMLERPDAGFTQEDIEDDSLRAIANARWDEFSSDYDLSLPVNRQLVRRLIVLEIQQRRVEREILRLSGETDEESQKELNALQSQYQQLGRQYTDAAEGMSALETQKETRHQLATLSLLAERATNVRLDWQKNKIQLHQQLEESTLIRGMAALHRVANAPEERVSQERKSAIPLTTDQKQTLRERMLGDDEVGIAITGA